MTISIRAFILLLFCLAPGLSPALDILPLQLQPSMDQLPIHERMEYLIEDEPMELEQLLAMDEPPFRHPERGGYNFPLNDRDYWFRFSVHNPHENSLIWLMEFNLEFVDRIQTYAIGADGERRYYGFDILQGHNSDYGNYRHPMLRLESGPGEHTTYYIRIVRNRVAPISPSSLRISSADQFQKKVALEYIAFGIFYGGMLVAMLYNLMLFVTVRSMSHLYYVIYILFGCTSWFTQNGLGYQYLWHHSEFMTLYAASGLALLAGISGSIYTRSFLETARLAPRIDRYILGIITLSTISLLLLPFIPIGIGNNLAYLLIALPVTTYPFIAAFIWYRGFKPARLFTVAWFFFGFGTLAFVLVHMGVLPNVAPYTVAGQVGNWIEAILLSIALADRLNLAQRERNDAKQRYQQMLLRSKDELERKVSERTAELARAKEEAEKLARTDALTGLPNRRSFFEDAEAEVRRTQRFEHPLSLFILDIDHFKSINDRFGHALGDQALRAVSNAIRECLRDTDIIGRIGGEEFAAALPQSGTDTAVHIAERLRQSIQAIEFVADGQRVSLSASIGLATMRENESLDQLLARADELLYQAKSGGRDRVIAAV